MAPVPAALVFHVIESPSSPEVSATTLERVVRLVKDYIVPVYRYLYDNEPTSSSTFDAWVMEHIIQHADLDRIKLSDIKASARRQFEKIEMRNTSEQSQWVLNAMKVLEDLYWVARVDDGTMEHRHVAEWLINPDLRTTFAEYRRSVIAAKQRVMDTVKRNAGSALGHLVHGIDEITE